MSESPRPHGFTAVMAQRAPLNPDDLDYFPTPPWAARAGGELIRSIDPLAVDCWEPACGGGHMAWGLLDYFDSVSISDIHDHGDMLAPYRSPRGGSLLEGMTALGVGDFLDPDFGREVEADWIVTNPPFVKGEAFVREAMRRARRGVAMLLRLQFLEGGARWRLFQDLPLYAVAPFAERVPMVKGRWDPTASSATAYAWFIWVKAEVVADGLATIAEPVVRFIAPGARERLSRSDDVARFCGLAAAPLLDGGV